MIFKINNSNIKMFYDKLDILLFILVALVPIGFFTTYIFETNKYRAYY